MALSPANDEQPTGFAVWKFVKEPLVPDDPAGIEQPSGFAVLTIAKELLAPDDPPGIEQPTLRAELELEIVKEPFSPWDVAEGPVRPGEP